MGRDTGKGRGWTAGLMTLMLAYGSTAFAVTTNSVTWSGGGGAGNPYWNVDANWVGGSAPSNPTPGMVTLGTNVTGKLEADRVVGKLRPATGTWVGYAHTLDLDGHELTVEGEVGVEACCNGFILTLTNGTLRAGSDTKAGSLLLAGNYSTHQFTLARGMRLQTATNTVIRGQATINADTSYLDLRGVEMVGGALQAARVILWGSGAAGAPVRIDSNTLINALEIVTELSIANGAFIGDIATQTLPSNLTTRVGVDAGRRGAMCVGGGDRTSKLAAGPDNSFAAYLTTLKIPRSDSAGSVGTLDLASATSCVIDTVELLVGVDRPGFSAGDVQRGLLRVPPDGRVTAGNAVVGGATMGTAVLVLDRASFVVTNSMVLNPTAWITNTVAGESGGLDIRGSLVDNGGHIRVVFAEAPSVLTNWGVRVEGNAVSELGGLAGCGRLTSTGNYAGWKPGVVYDAASNCTYFALVDESVALPVIASAREEITFEIAPGGSVQVAETEIDVGSYDPDGRTPVSITISSNGVSFASNLTFEVAGDYPVTLRIAVGDPVEASSTDTCTVHIVSVHQGVVSNLTWYGQAPSDLMDRREWMWSANWLEGVPPTNPTTGSLCYKAWGQSVVGKLDKDRTVGGLVTTAGTHVSPKPTHFLDLNGYTLNVLGDLGYNSCCHNFAFTLSNGTLRVGSAGKAGRILFGGNYQPQTVALTPGVTVETVNVSGVLSDSGTSEIDFLDLRGTTWVGGVFRVGELRLVSGGGSARMLLDGSVTGCTIAVRQSLRLGSGTGMCYVGDPADSKLPDGMNLTFGTSPTLPAEISISPGSRLVSRTGGALTGWFGTVSVGDGSGSATARLELASMDTCDIEAVAVRVGPTDNGAGVVSLPPGEALLGSVLLGSSAAGEGFLVLRGTRVQVTNSVTLNATGHVVIDLGAEWGGLDLLSDSANALTVAAGGAVTLNFSPSFITKPYYGIKWAGSHESALLAMEGDGRLIVNDTAIAPKQAVVYRSHGDTYVGVPPVPGSVFVVR